jgi:peptidoglycan/LPS O-acetylase OafA/YrhL
MVLDSLRGLCACLVVLYHFAGTGYFSRIPPIPHGGLFVDFFFVLSGFVITAGYRPRLGAGFPVGRFLLLRLGRIYPLHLFVLALFVALELLNLALPGLTARPAFSGSRTLDGLVANLLLLQTFNPVSQLSWNNPAWSIAAEFWIYAVAAAVFAWLPRRVDWAMAALAVASAVWLHASGTGINHSWDWGVVRCLYGFALGAIAWSAFPAVSRLSEGHGPGFMTLLELVMTGFVVLVVSGPNLAGLACPPVFMLAVLLFALEGGLLSRLLATAPMTLLGTLSYSIYLDHAFVQGRMLDLLQIVGKHIGTPLVAVRADGFKSLVSAPLVSDLLTLLMLALVIGTAFLTYRFVERPARLWSRRLLLGKGEGAGQPAAPPPATAV